MFDSNSCRRPAKNASKYSRRCHILRQISTRNQTFFVFHIHFQLLLISIHHMFHQKLWSVLSTGRPGAISSKIATKPQSWWTAIDTTRSLTMASPICSFCRKTGGNIVEMCYCRYQICVYLGRWRSTKDQDAKARNEQTDLIGMYSGCLHVPKVSAVSRIFYWE